MATNFWNGSLAQFLLNKIRFKDGVSLEQLAVDPSVVATDANTGSIAIFGTSLFQKQDNGSTTSWVDITSSVVVALQDAYDNSVDGGISLDAVRTAFKIKDNATPIAQELFEVLNNAETEKYFSVDSDGAIAEKYTHEKIASLPTVVNSREGLEVNIDDETYKYSSIMNKYQKRGKRDNDIVGSLDFDELENVTDKMVNSGNSAVVGGGGVLAGAVVSVSQISGKIQSASYTMVAGSQDDWFEFDLDIDAVSRFDDLGYGFLFRTDADLGDFEAYVRDSAGITYLDIPRSTASMASVFGNKTILIGFKPTGISPVVGIRVKNENIGREIRFDAFNARRNYQTKVGIQEENTYSAKIQNNGTASIISENTSFINNVNRTAAGTVVITFNTNFFGQEPVIVSMNAVQGSNPDTVMSRVTGSAASITLYSADTSSGSSGVDIDFDFVVQRQGADYNHPLENIVLQGSTSALDTKSYTPVFTGLGTTTEEDITWRQDGDVAVVEGFFRAGSVSATNASFTLPNSFTSKFTNNYPIGGFYRYVGILKRGNTASEIALIMEENSNIVFMGNKTGSNPLMPDTGSNLIGSNEYLSFRMEVPVNELSADSIMYSFSPTKHVTGGAEYPIPETWDGQQAYARSYDVGTLAAGNSSIATITGIGKLLPNGLQVSGRGSVSNEAYPYNSGAIQGYFDFDTNDLFINRIGSTYNDILVTIKYIK